MLKLYIAKAIVRHKNKFLLLKKLHDIIPENQGKWEAPGGKIALGEKPIDTIKREFEEETGIKDYTIITEFQTLHKKDPNLDSTCHVFLINTTTSKIKLSSEHSDYGWFTRSEIEKMQLVLFADLLLKYIKDAEKIK